MTEDLGGEARRRARVRACEATSDLDRVAEAKRRIAEPVPFKPTQRQAEGAARRIYRRFVTRGGELVEVEQVARETR